MGVIQDILRTMDYGPSPEGAEHVKAWLEAHRNGFGHFINGAFTKPGHLFDVFNPATGERIARVSQGSPADINGAIAAARKAQVKWAASTRSGMSATRPAPPKSRPSPPATSRPPGPRPRHRLGQTASPRVPAPCHASQKHLDPYGE
jgi:hypothetical protein